MVKRWLRDAQGQTSLDKRFLRYATSQGYRLAWDRDTIRTDGGPFSGMDVAGTFQLRNANFMKGGVRDQPEITLFGPGEGSGGGGGRGGSGSGGRNSNSMENQIADLLSDIGGEFASYAASNQGLIKGIQKSNNKLLKKLAKNKDTSKMLRGELRDSRTQLANLTSTFNDRFAQQQAAFDTRLSQMRQASNAAQNNFQRLLGLSQQRLDQAQNQFQDRLAQAAADREALKSSYEKQLAQTRALANAFVPQLEETAVAPRLGDDRSTEQQRRPRRLQSVSGLSIATPDILQIA